MTTNGAPERHSPLLLAGTFLGALCLCGSGSAHASAGVPIPPEGRNVLSRTTLKSDVTDAPGKETVVLTEFLTGKSEEADAIDVILTVYENRQEGAVPTWGRDYLKEWGGPLAGGELSLVDLDGDGRNEIMVSMHHGDDPGRVNVEAEILWAVGGSFVRAWNGPIRVDTSGADLPVERRERYTREIDFDRTTRTRGGMIFFNKKISMTAGVQIEPASVIGESFPLRARPSGSIAPADGNGGGRAAGGTGGS